jgi:hypothetical protein
MRYNFVRAMSAHKGINHEGEGIEKASARPRDCLGLM